MPGLFGWIGLDRDRSEDASDGAMALAEMAYRMSHTGDEVVETYRDPARDFAIGRVAVRGLTAVPWPSASEELDRAFVDGVLHGSAERVATRMRDLARRGQTALADLRGFFTAACWSPARRRLVLAVDRRASRPLAFAIARGRLWFAPEVKALLAAPGFDKTLDDAALGIFLGAGYVLAHQTLFASTRRLAGGEALVVEDGRHRVEPYHRYALSARGDGTRPRDLEEEMADLVRAAVGRNMGEARRTVVFLSGGVDSRAIAVEAQAVAKRQGARLSTVTWASPGARPGSDLHVAQRVADVLGARHRSILRHLTAWGARLTEVTYLLDGLTDLPAYHGYEHAVMRELARLGARVVLRGDECFGWQGHVASIEEARLSLNLRALAHLRLVDGVVRPAPYARWCEASASALASIGDELAGEHPDNIKDFMYFRHRLQSYLGSAAYLKHVLLDHRTPLLDEALLDLNARVPASLRTEKGLFCRAASRGREDVWRIPLATRGNLEDWDAILASQSPPREHVEREIEDASSAFWGLFDPCALRALLPPIGASTSGSIRATFEGGAKAVARAVLRVAPPIERRISIERRRAGIRATQIVMRAMVLKTWHDLFVTGDGSRHTLEARMRGSAI